MKTERPRRASTIQREAGMPERWESVGVDMRSGAIFHGEGWICKANRNWRPEGGCDGGGIDALTVGGWDVYN